MVETMNWFVTVQRSKTFEDAAVVYLVDIQKVSSYLGELVFALTFFVAVASSHYLAYVVRVCLFLTHCECKCCVFVLVSFIFRYFCLLTRSFRSSIRSPNALCVSECVCLAVCIQIFRLFCLVYNVLSHPYAISFLKAINDDNARALSLSPTILHMRDHVCWKNP